MIRFGLVGVGPWARRIVATIRRLGGSAPLYARSSRSNDTAIDGASRVDDWRALLERARADELDALVVATTPENQAEVAEAAVRAGVPAVVEKPLGLSRQAAEGVLEAVRASNDAPPLVVNYVQLYTPAHRTIQKLVHAAGGAGAIASIASEGSNRGPFRGFSSLYDYGPHDVSLCLDLLGATSEHHVESARKLGGDGGGELFEATLLLAGTRVTLRVGNGAAEKTRRFSVVLRNGRTLAHDQLAPPESMLTDDGHPVALDAELPLDVMLREFVARVEAFRRGERDPARELRNAEFSVRVNEVLDAIAAAAARESSR